MPTLILIAGPNGAGKTTFANEYLTGQRSSFAFVNADEIASELARRGEVAASDLQSARLMLERLNALVDEGRDIVVESTLASRTYAISTPKWLDRRYRVVLFYLRLASADVATERVRRRVNAGGHSIPEAVIRRRFARSLSYLETLYKPIVDEWYIWESLEGRFELKESWDNEPNA